MLRPSEVACFDPHCGVEASAAGCGQVPGTQLACDDCGSAKRPHEPVRSRIAIEEVAAGLRQPTLENIYL